MSNNICRFSTSNMCRESEENNRDEVRMLIGSARQIANGIYNFTDRTGEILYVETVKGKIGIDMSFVDTNGIQRDSIAWCDNSASKKKNGYIYATIRIADLTGNIVYKPFAAHSIICMISDTAEYDRLDNNFETPTCNHKNNIPWDNRAENLEWTTPSLNSKHGKIVSAFNRMFNGEYTHIENNLSDVKFVALNQGLSTHDIEKYISINGSFKTTDTDELRKFALWLEQENIWKKSNNNKEEK